MNHVKNFLLMTLAFFSLAAITPALAQETTYSYQGNGFDDFIESPSIFDGASVSGFFTVDSPIPANSVNVLLIPTDYEFTAGPLTLQPGPGIQSLLDVTTDANGDIIQWVISISGEFPDPVMVGDTYPEIATALGGLSGQDGGSVIECLFAANNICGSTNQQDAGRIVGNPGVWTISSASPPEAAVSIPTLGTGLWLLMLLMAGLGLTHLRRM